MIRSIVIYTTLTRDHPVMVVRLRGPLEQAGLAALIGKDDRDVSKADLVVIQRDFPRHVSAYRDVMERARALNKPVLYEIDDLLWNMPEDHPSRRAHLYTDALAPMLLAAMEADGITVSTNNLREQVCSLNPNVWVLPNYLNDRHWSFRPPSSTRDQAPVVIGYIGSIAGHEHDLEMILPTLERALRQYGQAIKFKFWGARPPAALLKHSNVAYVPLAIENYAGFASYCMAQKCDVVIAPLRPNLFNQCKSPIKFLEYAALGLPGIYSRLAPYDQIVADGADGFLASEPDEWYDRLVELIENPSLRSAMSRQAQEKVRQNWLLSDHAGEWRVVYEQAAGVPNARVSPPYIATPLVTAMTLQLVQRQQERERSLQWIVPRASRREWILDRALRIWRLWKREGLAILIHRGLVKIAPRQFH